jgi:hypothetical protein
MLICFFYIRGVINSDIVPEGTTVNQTFYVEVLKRLTDALRRKQGELWTERSLISSSCQGAWTFFASSVAVFNRNYELELTRNILIVDHFKVLSQHLVRGIEELHGNRTLAEILFPDFAKIKWEQ